MVYFGDFHSKKDVEDSFDVKLPGLQILIAVYEIDGYEGGAFVLARNRGKLYEVNGSHCSCAGLEGQWEPEEASIKALKVRRWSYSDDFCTTLDILLEKL